MGSLDKLVRAGRRLHAVGFDDGPFGRQRGAPVPLAGVVTSQTRFEGLLWGGTTRDGTDATERIAELLTGSKFGPQVHLVLLDGIAVGGLNVVDLPALAGAVGVPCVAVMRRMPDLQALRRALRRTDDAEARWATIQRAGPIHRSRGFTFQVQGADAADGPMEVAAALSVLTDRGKVPEPLRLAHLIASAVVTGTSSRRA